MSLAQEGKVVKRQTSARDAFLGGRLQVSQPAAGFRAGLESVLLGAAVRPGQAAILDLGAGVGTAALVALAQHPGRTATLVELDPQMAALAEDNLDRNGFAGRGRVLVLDVGATGKERAAAGLAPDCFQSVIANPPFFDPARGTAPTSDRAAARHMPQDQLGIWLKTALMHLAPGGEVIFIHAAEALRSLLTEFELKLGGVTVLPLIPREGQAASRLLVRGIKGSRAPTRLLASRALHAGEGRSFAPEFEAVLREGAPLHW